MRKVNQIYSVINAHYRDWGQRWYFWLMLYIVLVVASSQLSVINANFKLLLVNGGILLAALLVLNPAARWQRVSFIVSVAAVDWLLKWQLEAMSPLQSTVLMLTLIGQACLGYFLIRHFRPNATQQSCYVSVLSFCLLGCVMPALASSFTASYLLWLLEERAFFSAWLWWFEQRLIALVLISPLLVMLFSGKFDAPLTKAKKIECWLLWFICSAATTAVFLTANPVGSQVATYSFLLVPLLVYTAMRLPQWISLAIMLNVGVVALWSDAYSGMGSQDVAQHSYLALAAFLVINHLVVWLLGALVHERALSFAQMRKMRSMYEMLSNVNQVLVKQSYAEPELFAHIGQIIAEESEFEQICIVPTDTPEGGICVGKPGVRPAQLMSEESCDIVVETFSRGNANVSDSCRRCAQFAACQFQRKLGGSGAIAAFPVRKKQQLYAVLVVFSQRTGTFDTDLIRLFEEMAGDIGFALDILHDRQQLKMTAEVFEHSQELIIIADASGRILDVNPSFCRITGYTADEVRGQTPAILQSGQHNAGFYQQLWQQLLQQGFWSGEFINKRKNGQFYPQRGTISAVKGQDGTVQHFIGVMEDISERKQAEEHISRLANYDVLTGLPNRLLLEDRFVQLAAICQREQVSMAVLFIDLDDFKHVNDALGHQQGDDLLKQVSSQLQTQLRGMDTLARFGGDEFVVLMMGNQRDAAALAQRLLAATSGPYSLEKQQVHIGCSIGIALRPSGGATLDELVRSADAAMYRAKAKGRGAFAFFSQEMQHHAQSLLKLKYELDIAIADDQLCVFYQPQIAIDGNTTLGFEALVRWQHPEHGLIAPGGFIQLAEESGQIAAIDRWMLHTVIRQLASWHAQHKPILPIAVNVSASLFCRPQFVSDLAALLDAAAIPSRYIELEITERVAIADINHTLQTLKALKQLGVSLSIDDFGTGYSSLAYLRDFPIDTLKIDIAFIKNVHTDNKNQGIVRAIIALAKTLQLKTIAEGVETEDELAFLLDHGCWACQGYLFSKPIDQLRVEQQYLDLDCQAEALPLG